MDSKVLITTLIVLSIILIYVYAGWKNQTLLRILNWAFLILSSLFMLVGTIWAQGIPNGLVLGLLCAPLWFLIMYPRFVLREKIRKSVARGIESLLPGSGNKVSSDALNDLGWRTPDENDDSKKGG